MSFGTSLESRLSKEISRLEAKFDTFPARMMWTVGAGAVATSGLLLALLALLAYDGGYATSGTFAKDVESNRVAIEALQSDFGTLKDDTSQILSIITSSEDGPSAEKVE